MPTFLDGNIDFYKLPGFLCFYKSLNSLYFCQDYTLFQYEKTFDGWFLITKMAVKNPEDARYKVSMAVNLR